MKHVFLISLCFFLTSCTSMISYYKQPILASTKAVAVPEHKVLGKVEKKDCEMVLMMFIPIPANFRSMYSKVLEEAMENGGDAVIDFQSRSGSMTAIWPLFYRNCYVATGTAVKFKSLSSGWEGASEDGGSSVWDASPEQEQPKEQKTKSQWD